MFLLPGFTRGIFPSLQIGQESGSNTGTSNLQRVSNGTPKSTFPPLLSTKLPTATTSPPFSLTTSIVSLVDFPVVTTS